MAERLVRPPNPGPGGRIVWVSNDPSVTAGDGSGPTKVKRTIAAGMALVRDLKPDVLALGLGDTYNEPIGAWNTRGASDLERQVISFWGKAARGKPTVKSGSQNGVVFGFNRPDGLPSGGVTISGIRFEGSMGQDSAGVLTAGADVDSVVIENCDISRYYTGVCSTWHHTRKRWGLRGTVITECYDPVNPYNGNGMFWHNMHGYEIDSCLIFKNAIRPDGSATNAHGSYCMAEDGTHTQSTSGLYCHDSIFGMNGNTGLSARAGGVVENCTMAANAIGINFGASNTPISGGVSFTGRRIVVTESRGIGWALWMRNISGGLYEDVILANSQPGTQHRSYLIGGNNSVDAGWSNGPIEHLTTRRMIVHNHGAGPEIGETVGMARDIKFDDCEGPPISGAAPHGAEIIQTGRRFGLPQSYPDPGRTIARYDKEVLGGHGTLDHFFGEARKNWGKKEYSAKTVNAWIAAGFGKSW